LPIIFRKIIAGEACGRYGIHVFKENRLGVPMNHKHRKVLHALFAHPVSANISMHDVEAVLKELGGTIEQRRGARRGVHLKDHFTELSHTSHSLQPMQVQQVRKLIAEAGIDPVRDYPL
jgi:hypothetical protein